MINKKILILLLILMMVFPLINGCGKKDEDKEIDKGNKKDEKTNKETKKGLDETIWTYNVGGDTYVYYSTPTFSQDEETLYIGTSKKLHSPQSDNDKLIALSRDGKLKWEYSTNKGEVRSNIVVYKDYIYFVADYERVSSSDMQDNMGQSSSRGSSKLIVLKTDGTFVWSKQIAGNTRIGEIGLTNLIVLNDKVMVVTDRVYIFNFSNGELLHQSIKLQGDIINFVRVAANFDTGYFMLGNKLYEFNMDTYKLVSTDLGNLDKRLSKFSSKSAIRFDSANNMYIGGKEIFISLDKNKKLRWIYEHDTEGDFRSTSVINESRGELYVGAKANEKSKFIALNVNTGELIWSYHIGRDIYNSPSLDKNGLIYFAAETEKLHIFNPDGTLKSELDLGQQITWCSSIIDSKGILYIAGMDGIVYALQTVNK
jgi:outer membrane protein assembly factor BamB